MQLTGWGQLPHSVTAIDNHNTVVELDMTVYFFGNINNRNSSSKSSNSNPEITNKTQ